MGVQWLPEGELCLISIEHRYRLADFIRRGEVIRFETNDFILKDETERTYIIRYINSPNYWELSRTTSRITHLTIQDQLERYMIHLQTVVYPEYNPSMYA